MMVLWLIFKCHWLSFMSDLLHLLLSQLQHLHRKSRGTLFRGWRDSSMLILQNPEIFLDHLHNFATGHHTVISGKWRGHVQLNDGGIVAILPGREALIVGPTLAVSTDQIAILPWIVGPVSVHDLRCHPTASTPFVPLTHEVVKARNPGLQKLEWSDFAGTLWAQAKGGGIFLCMRHSKTLQANPSICLCRTCKCLISPTLRGGASLLLVPVSRTDKSISYFPLGSFLQTRSWAAAELAILTFKTKISQ